MGILPLNPRGIQTTMLYVDPEEIIEEMGFEHSTLDQCSQRPEPCLLGLSTGALLIIICVRKLPYPLCFSSGKGTLDLDLNTYSSKLPSTLGPLVQVSPCFAMQVSFPNSGALTFSHKLTTKALPNGILKANYLPFYLNLPIRALNLDHHCSLLFVGIWHPSLTT